MSYRVQIPIHVNRRILSWKLSDFLLVEVHLRLQGLSRNPMSQLRRATDPFDGMVYSFSMVDPENRLCEHFFTFQIVYGQDEETLTVSKAGYLRVDGL